MPKAARLTDMCSGHGCFPSTPIIAGSPDVQINFLKAARKGDEVLMHTCPCPPVPPSVPPMQHGMHKRSISEGSSNVFINDKAAARIGDKVNCGGSICAGSGDVFISDTPYKSEVQECVEAAVENNMPFVQIGQEISITKRNDKPNSSSQANGLSNEEIALIDKAVKDARSFAEAFGHYGGFYALVYLAELSDPDKRRIEVRDHPDFINRYHGPDHFGTIGAKLAEFEFKGYKNNSTNLNENRKGKLQGSSDKNRTWAKKMIGKEKKLNKPNNKNSKRQGGAYTLKEVELWKKVTDIQGRKKHFAIFTNYKADTEQVQFYEQNNKGGIIEDTLIKITIPNFPAIKEEILSRFPPK